ncbi:F-box/FBD/LRR-repeat protein At1g13570 [Morus notabilis]|uniref:F-box/FBD/LRR-repeat protein At1g13570 n=1 Tax=Morus notabilis TaxID=981085 RepID=UPI000CECF950|nr:F-box/FBD/LRR-repeat protein At1g13570 [Morus notabilis]XP_024032897.1 F-box/FBD/LRR-repeat protein At1g13570 [Morus notabilis]
MESTQSILFLISSNKYNQIITSKIRGLLLMIFGNFGIVRIVDLSLGEKEAVRTSIFSSRWRKLRKTSLKILDLDTKNCTNIDIEDLDLDDDAVVRWVNQILALYKCTKLEAFPLIRPSLHVDYSHEIDKWICFALSKKVEKLNISVYMYQYAHYLTGEDPYSFPHQLFNEEISNNNHSSLKHICLEYCRLNLPPNFGGFCSLKSLISLLNVQLTKAAMLNISTNCLSLEWLSTESFSSTSKRFKFGSGFYSCPLKHLYISCCDDDL